jgi:hypothetical protein
MGLRHSPLLHDLELYRFGFSYIEPPIQQGAAFRDGTCVVTLRPSVKALVYDAPIAKTRGQITSRSHREGDSIYARARRRPCVTMCGIFEARTLSTKPVQRRCGMCGVYRMKAKLLPRTGHIQTHGDMQTSGCGPDQKKPSVRARSSLYRLNAVANDSASWLEIFTSPQGTGAFTTGQI